MIIIPLTRMLAAVCMLLVITTTPAAAEKIVPAQKKVLIIHSYHSGLGWTDSIMSGIRDAFTQSTYDIQLSAEYLDARRTVDPEGIRAIHAFLLSKLKRAEPDLVIVTDNAAFNFILKERASLFPDVPVVFCGVNDFRPDMLFGQHGITGVAEDSSIAETVDIALKLHPKTKKIIVIGQTKVAADKYNRDGFVAALPKLPSRIRIDFWDDLATPELSAKLKGLKDDTVVFLNGQIRDKDGQQIVIERSANWISANSPVPVYSLWDVFFGNGILGGKLVSGYRQGQLAAELAVRILNGEQADAIPVYSAVTANQYMFDYQQLVRFGISLSQIPANSIVVRRPDSFYDKYKAYVWTACLVIFVLSGMIVFLSIAIIRRRSAEQAMQKSDEMTSLLFERQLIGMAITSPEKGWLRVNQKVCEMLGYAREELIRMTWEQLTHPDDVALDMSYFSQLIAGEIDEYILEKRFIRKDGTIIWTNLAIGCVRKRDRSLDYVLALMEDVTERKRIEMSLRQANQVIENSPVVLFRWRAAEGWPVEFVSKNVSLYGYAPEEFYSGAVPYASIIYAPDRERVAAEVLSYSASSCNSFQQEYRLVCKSGEIRWIDDRTVIERNAQGIITHYQGTILDITERKKAEEALRESQFFLNKSQQVAHVGSYKLDVTSMTWTTSPSLDEIFGISADYKKTIELWMSLIVPEDREAMYGYFYQHVLAAHNRFDREYRIVRSNDGTLRWIRGLGELGLDEQGNVLFMIGTVQDITEYKLAEEALRESEQRLMEIIDFLPDATFAIDREGKVIAWNRAIQELYGVSADCMLGKGNYEYALPIYGTRRPMLIDLISASDEEIEKNYHTIKREGKALMAEATAVLQGKRLNLWGKAVPLYNSKGDITGAIESIRDITEFKQTEEERARLKDQLFQSQKMETVGLLAGGVAHDFNNLLTPILGYSEIMMLGLPPEDPNRQKLEQIKHAADLAKGLTRRLLAFSRKQMLELKSVNLGEIIREFEQVLHRTIRENIEIRMHIPLVLATVKADKGQIEQALLNLAINAQDAMPEGGVLTIEVKEIDLDESYTIQHPEIVPGPYIMLSVSDTGIGMDADVQEHIFEPFFTTKELGRGTGLGLSTVYGIVKQHAGSISVYSEKKQGSIFKIFLPRVTEEGKSMKAHPLRSEDIEKGSETILVMEDNETVRTLACKMLESLGYHVLTAESTDHCVEMAEKYPEAIDLLLTDVIMPKKNGKELYAELKRFRPDLKVLFMSGYTADVISHHGVLDEDVNFLQKPFTVHDLSHKMRRAMGS